jgi:hypothetical protein
MKNLDRWYVVKKADPCHRKIIKKMETHPPTIVSCFPSESSSFQPPPQIKKFRLELRDEIPESLQLHIPSTEQYTAERWRAPHALIQHVFPIQIIIKLALSTQFPIRPTVHRPLKDFIPKNPMVESHLAVIIVAIIPHRQPVLPLTPENHNPTVNALDFTLPMLEPIFVFARIINIMDRGSVYHII